MNLLRRTQKSTPRHSTNPPTPASDHADAITPAQALGNQFMQAIQPKLSVNAPNDSYEQEADRMANRITGMGDVQRADGGMDAVQAKPLAGQVTPLVQRAPKDDKKKPAKDADKPKPKDEDKQAQALQRAPKDDKKKPDEKQVQTKRANAPQLDDEDENAVQRKSTDAPTVSPTLESDIARMQHGGRPLDPAARGYFEPRFGADFSHVRVHDDAEAARAADSINAQAFTQGEHIFFNSGRYQPGDTPGRSLLAHELTHTIQQGAATPAAPQAKALLRSPKANVIQRQEEGDDTQPPPPIEPDDRLLAPAAFARLQQAITANAGGFQPAEGKLIEPDRLLFDRVNIPSYKKQPDLVSRMVRSPYDRRFGTVGRVARQKDYQRGNPDQRNRWRSGTPKDNITREFDEKVGLAHNAPAGAGGVQPRYMVRVNMQRGGRVGGRAVGDGLVFIGTRGEMIRKLTIPMWGEGGIPAPYRAMQVEHLVELQLGNWQSSEDANALDNMILLNGPINEPSGSYIRDQIMRNIRRLITHPQIAPSLVPETPGPATEAAGGVAAPPTSAAAPTGAGAAGGPTAPVTLPDSVIEQAVGSIKKNYHVEFNFVEGGPAPGIPNSLQPDQFWTQDEIVAGTHMEAVEVSNADELGSASEIFLFNQLLGGVYRRFNPTGTISREEREYFGRRFPVIEKRFYNLDDPDISQRAEIGTLTVELQVGALSSNPAEAAAQQRYQRLDIPIYRIPRARYAAYVDRSAVLAQLQAWQAFIRGASPIQVDFVDIYPTGLYVRGRILTDVPMLRGTQIDFEIADGELRVSKTFNISDIQVPRPIQISGLTLSLAAGTETGVSASGRVDFGIERVGQGFIEASARSGTGGRGRAAAGFSLAGGFDFDSQLFNPAHITMRYEDGQFSGEGAIGIPEGKVRGIRSANLNVAYAEGRLTADGTVRPNIPGVQEGTMSVVYSEAEGLVISGTVTLAPNPAIRSGSLNARVERKPDGTYKVAAGGTAEPAIPNVNSQLTVNYDDGAFDAEVTADYTRGMLRGSLRVAATNRPIDPATGQPSGEPTNNITVYGGGQVTVRFSPWLEGTAGIRLLPNGEIEISGEIGLPSAVDVFPARRFDRNLFRVNVDIPIVGVSVLGQNVGVFATIGGSLDLTAGIGPGQIRDLRLGVTYNPAREEETHVTGHGEFVIPADAGLRLAIRGGLGAGIPIVSARAGIEIGGQLGLEGAARAAVDVDWTPARGVVLDAVGEVFVEPKFKFDVSAFVEVTADLLFDEIELYSQRWQLAQYEYGSNLRFGVSFPIHYEDNQPFNLSLDDLQFTTPDIDPMSVVSGILGL
ncbi:MAG: DUF4157 domain-containing protein [Anaerolinea sp.]|nr:DUF4157 domain-containing protein [Anaerolinea sp.]